MSWLNEIFSCYGDLRCPIASSVLGIGGKIPPNLLVAFKASKYDAILLFKNLELLNILFIQ